MKYLWVYLIVAALNYMNAQSNCEVTEQFAIAYKHQVEVMALDVMLNSGTADTLLMRIPDNYIDPVMESLFAVYNSGIPEADSVFNFFCINNMIADEQPQYLSHDIYVGLDTNFAWTESWLNEMTPSGQPVIDSLLEGFEYSVNSFSFIPTALLTFEEVINLPLLIRKLSEIEGVEYAEKVPLIGFTDNIRHEVVEGIDQFTFHLGWGDCFSGCIANRFWLFAASGKECSASLLDVYGTNYSPDFFSGGDCNLGTSTLNPSMTNSFEVFPNPVVDKINIRSMEVIQSISIYNSVGQEVLRKSVSDLSVEIDASILSPGLYFIRTKQGSVQSFLKM